jgi:hypothetical protein
MIYNHTDLKKPHYVSKNEDNTIFNYGKILENQVFSTKMIIYTFETEEEMIFFVQENGGTYVDDDYEF